MLRKSASSGQRWVSEGDAHTGLTSRGKQTSGKRIICYVFAIKNLKEKAYSVVGSCYYCEGRTTRPALGGPA